MIWNRSMAFIQPQDQNHLISAGIKRISSQPQKALEIIFP